MRTCCYLVNMLVYDQQTHDQSMLNIIFYGTEDEVFEDLKKAEQAELNVQLVHALDGHMCAVSKAKLQIIRQLLRHDLNKLPKHPAWGGGEVTMQDDKLPMIFKVQIQVSIRGQADPNRVEDITVPKNILLPPGVRL